MTTHGDGARGKAARAAALALAATALAGCALREASVPQARLAVAGAPVPDANSDATPDATPNRRIAADLVGVLSRVEAVAPARAPVVSVTAQSGEAGFARALAAALGEAGYALASERADGPSGPVVPVGYTVQRGIAGAARTATYTVAFGEVQARRSWSLAEEGDARWEPAGPLYVRGTDVASIAPAPEGTSETVPPPSEPLPGRPATVEIAAAASTPGAGAAPGGAAALDASGPVDRGTGQRTG